MGISFCYHKIGEPTNLHSDLVSFRNFNKHIQDYKVQKALSIKIKGNSKQDLWSFDDGYSNIVSAVELLVRNNIEVSIFVNMHNVINQEYFYWDCLTAIYYLEREKLNAIFPSFLNTINSLQEYIKYVAQLESESRLSISADLNSIILKSKMSSYFTENLKPLNVSELQYLSSLPLVSIGNHSFSHPSFGNVNVDLDKEILLNHRLIKNVTGKESKDFAFPFGTESDRNSDAEEYLFKLGYEGAFSTVGKPNSKYDNKMFRPRFVIGNWNRWRFVYKTNRVLLAHFINRILE